ncbi:vacuolar calcium ion transporter [Purpureocillium lilacinum]|uniref:Vacuolar calcium ion transporter n=1 Tax=Purpureocillium lilacinum TaxID=33203 RepID=A0A179GQB0_PURLI|nr:vacuolar calcium ion transporter [Purpureocillium lilacinum]OAQ79329.1 vacuolar calcium ion transporter [Purpureocillium lilacinum]
MTAERHHSQGLHSTLGTWKTSTWWKEDIGLAADVQKDSKGPCTLSTPVTTILSAGDLTISMTESSSEPPDIARSRAIPNAHGVSRRSSSGLSHSPPVNEPASSSKSSDINHVATTSNQLSTPDHRNRHASSTGNLRGDAVPGTSSADEKFGKLETGSVSTLSGHAAAVASPKDEVPGAVVGAAAPRDGSLSIDNSHQGNNNTATADDDNASKKKRGFVEEVRRTFWMVVTYSWLNVLLVFVPIGIVVANVPGVHGGIVFAMNCIAVIPLAGLLSFATESVASNMGDSLGALLNVTFGNAVELIIFIALVKDQIRIVQASLLGSILANLLLILGMGFFLGGLRYREQIYNSTVTQMSACLLSLSVISLVLPTAFHASFNDPDLADRQSLKISRGTSVILLLVYGVYLLFQLKSHAYMYESTPQHIVDAEAIPGPAASWLDTSSSESSSDSSSDSDSSSRSRDTMRRKVKKVFRGGRRRKSSVTSIDTVETNGMRNGSFGKENASPNEELASESSSSRPGFSQRISFTDTNTEVAVDDEKPHKRGKRHRLRRHGRKHRKKDQAGDLEPTISEGPENKALGADDGEPRRVDFAVRGEASNAASTGAGDDASAPAKRPFPTLRGMSVKNLAPTVFAQRSEPMGGLPPPTPSGPVPRVRYGIRRTNSLPDRLNEQYQIRAPGAMLPPRVPLAALAGLTGYVGGAADRAAKDDDDEHLSRPASVILLLLTTGLVAVCAEFLVGSIEAVTKSSTIGEIFIGLIILPIVGNAAEHVTAITVAMKNKMDLAIGVAVGSSIQIAIFVTPLIIILGWITHHDISLYFTLFETVSLFVSAFMVNFLVLDGRSNYLEGALLCAVYIIIAIVAFFYPDSNQASQWGD